MEKIIYPLKNMWITQVPGQGTHKYSQALDDQGLNYATIDKLYAPFTGKIIRNHTGVVPVKEKTQKKKIAFKK